MYTHVSKAWSQLVRGLGGGAGVLDSVLLQHARLIDSRGLRQEGAGPGSGSGSTMQQTAERP